jgi:hypothetical protein
MKWLPFRAYAGIFAPLAPLAILAALLAALLASSCNLSENEEPVRYISILAPDSLLAYDTILVMAMPPGSDSVSDTLWNAKLQRVDQLAKLPAGHYRGGAVDVLILGMKDGWSCYSLKVEYRGNSTPRLDSSPPWDTVPPRLTLKGPDSAGFREGQAMPDTGADCIDEHPWSPRLTVTGKADPARAGHYELEYACRDRAGNVSRRIQRFVVSRWPDTLAPELRHPADSVVTLPAGTAWEPKEFACRDDRDSSLSPVRVGVLDIAVPGEYHLSFHCADAAKNQSADWVLKVRVLPWPDHVPPQIVLAGRDTITLYEGSAFADPGAQCHDGQEDGIHDADPDSLRVARQGPVNPQRRGTYPLLYQCTDHAGNTASAHRWVIVARLPDSVPPVLRMQGPDSLETYDHEPYADSGATCRDDRDGPLPVMQTGKVDLALRGRYVLGFTCTDSAGGTAEARRVVRVVRRPDGVAPVLALKGADTLVLYDHQAFADPGASCLDLRDGPLPVAVSGSVDTAIRGAYPLAYSCADSMGNGAAKIRLVRVVRMPDSTRPALTLRGPDSLDTWEGTPYVDSGAACQDDRDGARPVTVAGAIDTGLRGTQSLRFACADSMGNAAAERVRKVRVIRVPDFVKPVITLLGSPSSVIVRGDAYVDAGATCLDDRDGNLPLTRLGAVDVSRFGVYTLKYGCADSVGNRADTVTRSVTVALSADIVKPVLTLRGPDTIPVLTLAHFDDPGAACEDDRDGTFAAVFAGFDPPAASADGIYRARYTCTDKSGNVAEAFRTVKSGLYTTSLMVTQDASIDTTSSYNNGNTGISAICKAVGDPYVSMFKFDLSKVVKAGLKSAKVRFVVWARAPLSLWPGTAQDYSIQLWAVKRAWVEGTGNWFFHRGTWENGGDAWFADYFVADSIKNNSSDPAFPSGITGTDRDMFRRSNANLMASQKVNIRFPIDYTGLMAAPKDLRVIEIDVTNYVKNTDPAQDFGFFPISDNEPEYIGIINRELNGGQYAARLMLSY